MLANIQIVQATWLASEKDLRAIRTSVFIDEQLVAPDFEWDEIDKTAVHLLAIHKNVPIACLRIIECQKIGRMAVQRVLRGANFGKNILNALIEQSNIRGDHEVCLHAQTSAIGFYRRLGFESRGAPFEEAGIGHLEMFKRLNVVK